MSLKFPLKFLAAPKAASCIHFFHRLTRVSVIQINQVAAAFLTGHGILAFRPAAMSQSLPSALSPVPDLSKCCVVAKPRRFLLLENFGKDPVQGVQFDVPETPACNPAPYPALMYLRN